MIIHIDPIQESDFAKLVELFKEFAIYEKVPERMTNTLDQMNLEKDMINGFVAKNESDEIIGYVIVFFAYYTWVGKSLYMDDLYVREEYRGKGVGTLLINKVKEYAIEKKCNKLRWQVADWNDLAIGFYKSIGAQIDNIERNCDLMLK